MIWVSWRQFRGQAVVGLGALLILAVVARLTGTHLVDLYERMLLVCKAQGDCGSAAEEFLRHDAFLQGVLNAAVLVVPPIIGVFWGAPLVAREFEFGTYRLGWTQSVTRRHWLWIKVALVGLVSMTVTGLLSLVTTWWFGPLDRIQAVRFSPVMFSIRGIAPIGYAAFAFALGVTAGLLVRRTLSTMALTLAGFVGARLAVVYWLRPRFIAPVQTSMGVNAASGLGFGPAATGTGVRFIADNPRIKDAWVHSTRVVDSAGHAISSAFIAKACPLIATPPVEGGPSRRPANPAIFQGCVSKIASVYHLVVTYQPASRYWPFQWYETAVFLGAAVALCGFSVWWVRRAP